MTAKSRRSVFGAGTGEEQPVGLPLIESAHQAPIVSSAAPLSVVEQLHYAEPKSAPPSQQRRRINQVSYRGFPDVLKQAIHEATQELLVSTDEFVLALLEYALGKYQAGKLPIDPQPTRIKMTLFPTDPKPVSTGIQNKKPKAKKIEPPRWATVVTFRGIPPVVRGAVKDIGAENDIPIGEVAAFLIDHALRAFRSGELVLHPVPKPGAKTLYKE